MEPTDAAVSGLRHITEVVGESKAGLLLGLNKEQVHSLSAGRNTFVRSATALDYGEPSVLWTRIRNVESHIDRLQHVEPKGVSRAEAARAVDKLSRDMRYEEPKDRTPARRRRYMMHLRDVGMDPADVPDALAT